MDERGTDREERAEHAGEPSDGREAAVRRPASSASGDLDGGPVTSFGRAVSWSYVLTGGRTFVTLVVSLVLARLLGPEVFGAVAMANVFILFVEMFVRQGLVAAIVQRKDLSPLHLDTAFWMTAATVAILVPVTVGLSGWWAAVNDLPALRWLIIGLAPTLLLKGLGVVQEAQIRRAMNFRVLALRTNVAVVVGGVVGVSSAFAGAGVWALVAQQVTTAAIELVLIWRLSPWRPRRRFARRCAEELWSFSGRTMFAAFGQFVNVRSDALLIGLFFGPVAVGLYRMAVRFIDIMLEVTAGALQSVFLPELSRTQGDRETFNARTVEVLRLGAILAIPVVGALAAASDPLMLLLGAEWTDAAPVLRILCVLAAVQAIGLFIAPILQAAGRPGVHAWLTWISAALSAGSFTASGLLLAGYDIATQIYWLAAIRVAVFVPTLFLIVLPVFRVTTGLAPMRVIRAIWPAAAAALVGYGAVWSVRQFVGSAWMTPPLVGIVVAGSLAALFAAATLFALEPVARTLPGQLKQQLRRRRS